MAADLRPQLLDFHLFLLLFSLHCLWQGGHAKNGYIAVTLIHTLLLACLFSCTLVVSILCGFSLNRRIGLLWLTSKDTVSACSKVGIMACSKAGAVGPGPQEHSPIPHSHHLFHHSGNSAGNCVENPGAWIASITVTVCCIHTALH